MSVVGRDLENLVRAGKLTGVVPLFVSECDQAKITSIGYWGLWGSASGK